MLLIHRADIWQIHYPQCAHFSATQILREIKFVTLKFQKRPFRPPLTSPKSSVIIFRQLAQRNDCWEVTYVVLKCVET